MIVDNFDEMLEKAINTPLVMGIALHSYLIGQPTASDTSGAPSGTSPIIGSASP